MKPYKSLYEKSNLKEMALIGTVGQMKVIIWTDHNPPHFHVEKKDEYEARLSIDTIEIIDYKWQKSGKEMTSSELKTIKKWLNEPSKKNNKVTNLERIKIVWDALNPKE